MGGLGEFLQELVAWLYQGWPFRIVKDWEQGVRLRAGQATSLLTSSNGLFGTGVHLFIPGLGEVIVQETNIETPETDLQDFVSKVGTAWAVALALTFRVRDLRALYAKVHDHEQTIISEAKAAAAAAGHALDDEEMADRLGELTLEEVKARTRGWGLDILRIAPTTLTRAPQIRLVGDVPRGD